MQDLLFNLATEKGNTRCLSACVRACVCVCVCVCVQERLNAGYNIDYHHLHWRIELKTPEPPRMRDDQ